VPLRKIEGESFGKKERYTRGQLRQPVTVAQIPKSNELFLMPSDHRSRACRFSIPKRKPARTAA
jgi:hypothetical protein